MKGRGRSKAATANPHRLGDEHDPGSTPLIDRFRVVETSLGVCRTSRANAKLWGSDAVLLRTLIVNPQLRTARDSLAVSRRRS